MFRLKKTCNGNLMKKDTQIPLNKKNKVKGFKGFHYDTEKKKLFSYPKNGTKTYFPLNKKVSVDGKIRVCSNGLHFCTKLKFVKSYYCLSGISFYAEVTASGDIDNFETEKYAAQSIVVNRIIPMTKVLTEFGFERTGGAKQITDIFKSDSHTPILCNTPELYIRYKKETMKSYWQRKPMAATVVYYKRKQGWDSKSEFRLITEIH